MFAFNNLVFASWIFDVYDSFTHDIFWRFFSFRIIYQEEHLF